MKCSFCNKEIINESLVLYLNQFACKTCRRTLYYENLFSMGEISTLRKVINLHRKEDERLNHE